MSSSAKSSNWPWIAGGVVLGLVGLAVFLGGEDEAKADSSTPAGGDGSGGTTPSGGGDTAPSGGGGSSSGGSGSGGSSSGSSSSSTSPPPNISGDSSGYNTTLFPSPTEVRVVMKTLGYDVAQGASPLVSSSNPTNAQVSQFQDAFNRVTAAIASGKLKGAGSLPFPLDKKVPNQWSNLKGRLSTDGVPGKYTLRAMEIAYKFQNENMFLWSKLVAKA
jgi:hypothetical protein